LHTLIQTSSDPSTLKYAIQNLGVGVGRWSINWPLILKIQQTAVNRYVEVLREYRNPRNRQLLLSRIVGERQAPFKKAIDAVMQQRTEAAKRATQQLQLNLQSLARMEALEQFDLFMRQIALQGTKIVVGKLKKMQVMSQQSISSLQEKMKIGDVETRWMGIQIIGIKRYHLESDLLDRLGDPDNSVRQAARKALSRLGRGVDFGPSIKASKLERDSAERQWRQWWSVQDINPKGKIEAVVKTPR
jgi:hypothetical protein